MHTHTFTKQERLCSKKIITDLFSAIETQSAVKFPLRAVWKFIPLPEAVPAQVLISIPKKKFRRAHDRNRLKRQVRESYRNQKSALYDILSGKHLQCAIVLVYIAPEKLNYSKIDRACHALLKDIAQSAE